MEKLNTQDHLIANVRVLIIEPVSISSLSLSKVTIKRFVYNLVPLDFTFSITFVVFKFNILNE